MTQQSFFVKDFTKDPTNPVIINGLIASKFRVFLQLILILQSLLHIICVMLIVKEQKCNGI